MHYVICYDLENDRLREKAAKTLQRLGCERVQKSVFVAAAMKPKHLEQLKEAMGRLFAKNKVAAHDSLLIIPLPDACAKATMAIGLHNKLLATVADKPLKTLL